MCTGWVAPPGLSADASQNLPYRPVSDFERGDYVLSGACLWFKWSWGNVVDVVADRLQGNAEKNFHHLVFPVTRGKELLNGLRFRIAAFADQFSHQTHEGVELGIWNGCIVVNCCDNLWGREEALRNC